MLKVPNTYFQIKVQNSYHSLNVRQSFLMIRFIIYLNLFNLLFTLAVQKNCLNRKISV